MICSLGLADEHSCEIIQRLCRFEIEQRFELAEC